jgi:hypothetical protein
MPDAASHRHQGRVLERARHCSSLERDGVDVPLDAEARAELESVFKAKGPKASGSGVATREVAAKDATAAMTNRA